MTVVREDGLVGSAFEALADPTRRRILFLIAGGEECTAGEIALRTTTVARNTVSTHLRILRTAGLVHERRSGRHRFYSVDQNGPARHVLTTLQTIFGGVPDSRS